MIFERGVQANYGNSTDCFTMAGEYVNVKLVPIRAKRGKFFEFRTLRSHLLAFLWHAIHNKIQDATYLA